MGDVASGGNAIAPLPLPTSVTSLAEELIVALSDDSDVPETVTAVDDEEDVGTKAASP